ncbi:hypothetical protein GCM10027569_52540 [Flindersiella endophytica]
MGRGGSYNVQALKRVGEHNIPQLAEDVRAVQHEIANVTRGSAEAFDSPGLGDCLSMFGATGAQWEQTCQAFAQILSTSSERIDRAATAIAMIADSYAANESTGAGFLSTFVERLEKP